MRKRTFVVKYPPDYDGELHIHTELVEDRIGAIVKILVEARVQPEEGVADVVRRVGADMQRARG
jgi:hypothetical protein